MGQLNRSALVPYSAEQMYRLVNDVGAYPIFLPGCVSTEVLDVSDEQMLAAVAVAKVGMSKTFTTRNRLEKNRSIVMELVDGPFRSLMGAWYFIPLSDDACKVEFRLNFEFKNKLVELAFGKAFKELTEGMVQAFINRAKEVYRV